MTRAERRREGKRKVKYIKDELFLSVDGKPFKITETDEEKGNIAEAKEASIPRMLRLVLESYENNHRYHVSKGQIISTPGEVETFNRAKAILKEEPQEAGHYRLEDSDIILIQKILAWVWPIAPWFLNGPSLEKIVREAPANIPQPQETETQGDNPSVNGSKEVSKAKAKVN